MTPFLRKEKNGNFILMENIKNNNPNQIVWGRKEYNEYVASLPKFFREKLEEANRTVKESDIPEEWRKDFAATAHLDPIRIDLSLESGSDLQHTSQNQ